MGRRVDAPTARDAATSGDFDTAKLRESFYFEAALVAVIFVHVIASIIGWRTGANNRVPMICSSAVLVWHLMFMWLRWRNVGLHCLSICTLVVDCVVISIGSTSMQVWLWDHWYHTWGAVRDSLMPDDTTLRWDGLWATFIITILVNYESLFVFSFRHVKIGVPAAAVIYTLLSIVSRVSVWSQGSERMKFDLSYLAMEMIVFWAGIGLTVYGKKRAEAIERKLFELSEKQRQTIIDEKVLRCQAEFKLEVAKRGPTPGATKEAAAPAEASSLKSFTSSSQRRPIASEAGGSEAPLSILSAPANMTPVKLSSFLRDAIGGASRRPLKGDDIDCLPLDAKVWIEGSTAPSPLGELAPGQRVLCYDALGQDVKYVNVTEARADFQDVEWVNVYLEDGTELTMTADHPVQPNRRDGSVSRKSKAPQMVKAADLSPGAHSVMVHRVVTRPVAVKEVSPPEIRLGCGRMYVTMQHPDRHSLLVAGPNAQKDVRSMAVGSADAGAVQQRGLELKNTFLTLPSDDELERGGRSARAYSEPRSFQADRFRQEPGPSCAEEAAMPRSVEEEVSDNCSSQAHPSTISSESGEAAECNVKVLDTTLPGTSGGRAKSAVARVSDLLYVNRMGWPSLGSREHLDKGRTDCRLCDFHGQPSGRGRACKLGKFCDHCHVAEEHKLTRIRGKGGRRPKAREGEGVAEP